MNAVTRNVVARTFTGAALAAVALFVGACSSGSDEAAPSPSQQVHQKLVAVSNPGAKLTDVKLDQLGTTQCALIRSRGGDTSILRTLAENTPVDGFTPAQQEQMSLFVVGFYCPEAIS